MLRKTFFTGAAVCIATVAGYNMSKSINDGTGLEVLTLGNVQALGYGEVIEEEQGKLEKVYSYSPINGGRAIDYFGIDTESLTGSTQSMGSDYCEIKCRYGHSSCTPMCVPCDKLSPF